LVKTQIGERGSELYISATFILGLTSIVVLCLAYGGLSVSVSNYHINLAIAVARVVVDQHLTIHIVVKITVIVCVDMQNIGRFLFAADPVYSPVELGLVRVVCPPKLSDVLFIIICVSRCIDDVRLTRPVCKFTV